MTNDQIDKYLCVTLAAECVGIYTINAAISWCVTANSKPARRGRGH